MLVKLDLRRRGGHCDIVSKERAVRAVRLLLDRHREFLQPFAFKPRLAQHARKFSSKCTLVCVPREERDALAALATSP